MPAQMTARVRFMLICIGAILVGGVMLLYYQTNLFKPGLGADFRVSGTVTVDGEPLEEGTITFIPDPTRGNASTFFPSAKIDNGRYEILSSGQRGAGLGWYKVIVLPPTLNLNRPPPELFNRRYMNPDLTPLTVQVQESASDGAYDIRLTTTQTEH